MERYELEESREYKVAMVLEDALNNTCFDYKMFAESVKYYHPTLTAKPVQTYKGNYKCTGRREQILRCKK